MKFDYVDSVRDKQPRLCTLEQFKSMTESPFVSEQIARYRAGDGAAKQRLPAFCFHATFGGKARLAKHAQPSGLVMADFDHVPADALADARERLAQPAEALGVMLVHVTPSGQGLRVVFKAQHNDIYSGCASVTDFQQRLATTLGLADWLDPVAHDLARLSFCPQKADIVFFTSRLFSEQPALTAFSEPGAAAVAPAVPQPAAPDSHQSTYDSAPLTSIFASYFQITGGLPAEGGRNARFYAAARDLRYICDFNPHVLARHMPDVGLTPEEVYAVCANACQSSRASRIPAEVTEAVAMAAAATLDDPEETPVVLGATPKLPVIFRPIVETCPESFKEAAVLALLPMVGTIASGVRARYLDGELHSPSFLTVVTAEQASGKSFARRLFNVVMSPLREEDAAQRAIENAYRLELRRKKNAKEQPTDPRAVVRVVPASVSIAKLLQRLDYAEGKHIFSFAEELDTVIKSNQGGAWSQKSDIYRNAFDNAEYGQDYMSENSYSATVNVYYNLLFLGTPRQTRRFFSDVENGLVSRTCFATLPDAFGQQMPVMQQIPAKQLEDIMHQLSILRGIKGEVQADFLLQPMNEWLEEQRLLALKENNRARDIFRKRAAVMGFRAAAMLVPCYARNGRNSQLLAQFALYVANLVLRGQLAFAGERLNAIFNATSAAPTRSAKLFEELPAVFTVMDLTVAMRKQGMKSPPRTLVYLWQKNGLIEKKENEKNTYEKLKKNGTDTKTI